MLAADYLDETESAVRHLFEGLDSFDALKPSSITPYIDKNGLVRMSKSEADAFVQTYMDYYALDEARAVLAGSILQVAYNAIKLFSPGGNVTQQCRSLGVSADSHLARLCVGREVHNIPIGLLMQR